MRIVSNRTKYNHTRGHRVVADTDVAPEASELLFDANDVADLVAEVTGEDVEVTAEDTSVTFDVGEESYTVEAEDDGSIEEVESSVRVPRRKRPVSASTRSDARRPAKRIARRR